MVEIKELVVRASVNQTPINQANSFNNDDGGEAQTETREGTNEDIIEACVRQVLAILERQKER